jgi:two-component system alkaline phosphatase synthesis response regulator PhoP
MANKIYIIEDNANILYGLQAKLSVEGFNITIDSGRDEEQIILRKIKENIPDLIIVDLILPNIDGFKIIKALKADSETSKIPVFIFTNLSDEDSRSKGLRLGAEQYFLKNDLNIDDLVDKIKKIFNNKKRIDR